MSDRETILSAMYQDDADDDATAETRPPVKLSSRTRRIRVGAIEYEVPTIEYLAVLEQSLVRHARILDQQQRLIDRLAITLSKTHNSAQGQSREMDELRRELSRKINQRDSL